MSEYETSPIDGGSVINPTGADHSTGTYADGEVVDVSGAWLTAARRRAIYGLAVAVGVLLVAYGVVTDSQWQPILGVVEQALVLLTVVLPHTDEASTRSAA